MNLSQAVKTGKPFRRPNWKSRGDEPSWVEKRKTSKFITFTDTGDKWTPHAADIAAQDFVVKQENRKIRLTRSEDGAYKVRVLEGTIEPGEVLEFVTTDDEEAEEPDDDYEEETEIDF